jgi:hypothetical protein
MIGCINTFLSTISLINPFKVINFAVINKMLMK